MFANCIKFNNDDLDTNIYRKEADRQRRQFRRMYNEAVEKFDLHWKAKSSHTSFKSVTTCGDGSTKTRSPSTPRCRPKTYRAKRKSSSNLRPSSSKKRHRKNNRNAGPVCQVIQRSHGAEATSNSTRDVIVSFPQKVSNELHINVRLT